MWRMLVVLIAVIVVLLGVALVVNLSGGDGDPGRSRLAPASPSGTPPGADLRARDSEQQGSAKDLVRVPPDTDDPAELGRWIAEVVYGADYRDERAVYVDALWSVSLGADADDAETARTAFAADPALAGIVELVPEPDMWERMATHGQWARFDVAEPVGVADADVDPELSSAGVRTAMVLVTGRQLIHYIGEDGTPQTHTIRPSLQMLIGCADRLGGCRLLRVVDRQP